MYEFNLESVFLSEFFKKKLNFANFSEATLKTCPITCQLCDFADDMIQQKLLITNRDGEHFYQSCFFNRPGVAGAVL